MTDGCIVMDIAPKLCQLHMLVVADELCSAATDVAFASQRLTELNLNIIGNPSLAVHSW